MRAPFLLPTASQAPGPFRDPRLPLLRGTGARTQGSWCIHRNVACLWVHTPGGTYTGGLFLLTSRTVGETGLMASESISYHDTILGRVWEGGGTGDMEVDV